MKIAVFWFRRDLRLEDNIALMNALKSGYPVLPIFIFDKNILDDLPSNDPRLNFIYKKLHSIDLELKRKGSSIYCGMGEPLKIWQQIISNHEVQKVFANKDYEPYALERDKKVSELLEENRIELRFFKDQVIFEEDEILKNDQKPYTIYTPYKNKWLQKFDSIDVEISSKPQNNNFYPEKLLFPKLDEIGFQETEIEVKEYDLSELNNYSVIRDFPAEDKTSYLSPHLRFGTVSIRSIIKNLDNKYEVFLSELIWREFFMQILYHFPEVIDKSFKPKYDDIQWRNNEEEFRRWCEGKTGYPLVDAGMRQLNETGYMHNRVRMVVASFLCKHLLIDWRWGEAYFAEKLLDYELSSNNGNWQWAAGTGCDAAPYFRIFNPSEQLKKFDKQLVYTKRWIPEYGTRDYVTPMVEHKFARERALKTYKVGLSKAN